MFNDSAAAHEVKQLYCAGLQVYKFLLGRQLVVSGYRVWRFPGGTEMTDSIIILMSNSIGAAIAVQILSFPCVE
jgi:hypothetical protein